MIHISNLATPENEVTHVATVYLPVVFKYSLPCTWENHMLPLRVRSCVEVEGKVNLFSALITEQHQPAFSQERWGNVPLPLSCLSVCVSMRGSGIHSWVPRHKKCNIRVSKNRWNSQKPRSYFNTAISHGYDGQNLIVLATKNALIVLLIPFPAMWENKTRISHKKVDIVCCHRLNHSPIKTYVSLPEKINKTLTHKMKDWELNRIRINRIKGWLTHTAVCGLWNGSCHLAAL